MKTIITRLLCAAVLFTSMGGFALAGNEPSELKHQGEGVILLHGLARSSKSMKKMKKALEEEGYAVLNVQYSSRTAAIETLSESAVGKALSDPTLSSCTTIHFVTHSLGGILVRHYFQNQEDRRLGRVVMLGPPNQGSEVVDTIGDWWLFKKLNGPAGDELGTGKTSMPNQLGPVNFELGVIAGDRSINWINSLMIPGPDDGKVSVEHSKVEGMTDHIVLHVTHTFMMRNTNVIKKVISFLKKGSF